MRPVFSVTMKGHTQIVMIRVLLVLGMMNHLKKLKLKKKGKKLYTNAHGNVYRVAAKRGLARLVRRRKMLRKLEAKVNT